MSTIKRKRSNEDDKPSLPKIPKKIVNSKDDKLIQDLIDYIGDPEFEKINFLKDNYNMFNSFSNNIISISNKTVGFDNNHIIYMYINNHNATLTTKFFNKTRTILLNGNTYYIDKSSAGNEYYYIYNFAPENQEVLRFYIYDYFNLEAQNLRNGSVAGETYPMTNATDRRAGNTYHLGDHISVGFKTKTELDIHSTKYIFEILNTKGIIKISRDQKSLCNLFINEEANYLSYTHYYNRIYQYIYTKSETYINKLKQLYNLNKNGIQRYFNNNNCSNLTTDDNLFKTIGANCASLNSLPHVKTFIKLGFGITDDDRKIDNKFIDCKKENQINIFNKIKNNNNNNYIKYNFEGGGNSSNDIITILNGIFSIENEKNKIIDKLYLKYYGNNQIFINYLNNLNTNNKILNKSQYNNIKKIMNIKKSFDNMIIIKNFIIYYNSIPDLKTNKKISSKKILI